MRIPYFTTLAYLIGAPLCVSALAGCSSSTSETGRPSSAAGAGGSGSSTANSASGGPSNVATTNPAAVAAVGATGIVMDTSTSTTGGDACQMHEVNFTPDIPTVFILVDRSSSMWDNMFWDSLRDGVLDVVQRLSADVRFGFGTFTGIMGQTCPLEMQDVGNIDKNNYDAIASFYQGIGRPNMASETPTPVGLQRARELLLDDNVTFPGPKFILLVTDGNPDYCDNGQVECRTDTTVRVLQDTYLAGIPTFVVALPDPGINQEWLTAFANAGVGEPVSAPQDTQFCSPMPAETAALLPDIDAETWPQGSYGASMGTAVPYNVDPAQKEELVSAISGLIAGVKSCVFDLTDANGEEVISIAEGMESQGSVVIKTATNPDGMPQSYDAAGMNGWRVNRIEGAADQIELLGSACDLLRNPDTTGIEFDFPCEIIIEVPK